MFLDFWIAARAAAAVGVVRTLRRERRSLARELGQSVGTVSPLRSAPLMGFTDGVVTEFPRNCEY